MIRSFVGLLLAAVSAVAVAKTGIGPAAAPALTDALPKDSVWIGTQEQGDRKEATPIVLWVQSRDEDAYTATMWYPKFGNGLITIRAQTDSKSGITLDSDEVVFGKNFKSGATSHGELKKESITSTGKFHLSDDSPGIEVVYKLKRIQ